MKAAILSDFKVVVPPNVMSQADVNAWTLRRHLATRSLARTDDMTDAQYEKIFQRYAVKENLIASRSFECSDILTDVESPDYASAEVYPVGPGQLAGSDIGARTKFFVKRASRVFEEIYQGVKMPPSHIVHVTCTGYRSPSAAQLMVASKDWGQEIGITHAYHMGCYASLPSVRIAEGLVGAKRAFGSRQNEPFKVDVVHTEMCGLHMNAGAHTAEQIVVQTLFADGHIKYTISDEEAGKPGFRVLGVRELVVPDSDQDMSWQPEKWGLQMNLSREVPEKIKSVITPFFSKLAEQAGMSAECLHKEAIFAVHPGGPKIINAVQEIMNLSDEQTGMSKKILRERGNMSSATLPHVWNEILKADAPKGTKVVSFAFGPGLTVFGGLFEVV